MFVKRISGLVVFLVHGMSFSEHQLWVRYWGQKGRESQRTQMQSLAVVPAISMHPELPVLRGSRVSSLTLNGGSSDLWVMVSVKERGCCKYRT